MWNPAKASHTTFYLIYEKRYKIGCLKNPTRVLRRRKVRPMLIKSTGMLYCRTLVTGLPTNLMTLLRTTQKETEEIHIMVLQGVTTGYVDHAAKTYYRATNKVIGKYEFAPVAQGIEHRIPNPGVVRSNRIGGTK